MANAKNRRHKIKPEPPKYEAYGLFDDCCWYCYHTKQGKKRWKRNCNQCKIAKRFKRSYVQAVKYRREKGEFNIWGQKELLI